MFLNGEKMDPNSIEQYMIRNPNVSAALAVDAQRLQAALLVEPVTKGKELTIAERAALIERIWPTNKKAKLGL